MNPTKRLIGCRGLGLLCALLWTTGATAGEPTGFYQVGVEAVVPLPVAAKQDPRTIGMEKAKKLALDRLLHRMFTRADLDREKAFFDSLGQGVKRLTERVVVVGETQRPNALSVAVDVTFSARELTAALAQKGLSYSESRHPPVLFLVRIQGGTPEETTNAEPLLQKNLLEEAKAFGLPVVTPMGDVEDMGHLSWDKAAAGDPELRQWALTRYATEQIWAVAVLLTPQAGGGGSGSKTPTGSTLQAHLLGGTLNAARQSPPEPLEAEVASATPPSRCVDSGDARNCPYTVLARTLLQKMMDQWIQDHTIHPNLLHTTALRVIHGPKLAQFAQFVTKLRAMPGVTSLKFLEEQATESHIQVEFQGEDAQLREGLSRLGVQVEAGGTANPPGVTNPPGAANPAETAQPARVEMVLHLP